MRATGQLQKCGASSRIVFGAEECTSHFRKRANACAARDFARSEFRLQRSRELNSFMLRKFPQCEHRKQTVKNAELTFSKSGVNQIDSEVQTACSSSSASSAVRILKSYCANQSA